MTTMAGASSLVGVVATPATVQLFEALAEMTWDWLGHARQLRFGISEDSITDITELEIARASLPEVKLTRVTRQDERFYGFDWLWFIGNRVQGYIPYAVQAKKITIDTSGHYSYRIRYKTGGEFQIDILEQFAKCYGTKALYCFYNNVDAAMAIDGWHCTLQPDIKQMGCTLVPLDTVQEVHKPRNRKDFRAIHQDQWALPWRCLFHPGCIRASGHRQAMEFSNVSSDQTRDDAAGSFRRVERIPAFLLDDSPTVELDDVIDQLELVGLDDVESVGRTPRRRIAAPEGILVVESEVP